MDKLLELNTISNYIKKNEDFVSIIYLGADVAHVKVLIKNLLSKWLKALKTLGL